MLVLFIPFYKKWDSKRYMIGKIIEREGDYVKIRDIFGEIHYDCIYNVKFINSSEGI